VESDSGEIRIVGWRHHAQRGQAAAQTLQPELVG
jgi:hypothetical protein